MAEPKSFRQVKSCAEYCNYYNLQDQCGLIMPWCSLHKFEIDADDPNNVVCDDYCEEDEEL